MKTNRALLAVAAGVVAFGAVAASANTLGGLNSRSLGADQTVVAACDSDGVDLKYVTAYDAATKSYRVTDVTLADVAEPCVGQEAKITLGGQSGSVAEVTGAVTGASQTYQLTTPVAADAVTTAAVVIAS